MLTMDKDSKFLLLKQSYIEKLKNGNISIKKEKYFINNSWIPFIAYVAI
jgi:hypothetical protein